MARVHLIKKKTLNLLIKIVCDIAGQDFCEKLLLYGCRKAVLRKCFRLGAFAYEFSTHLTGDSIRLAQVNNYSLYVNLLEPPGVSSYFFGYSNTLPFMNLLLRPGDIFVDAGANMGQYTFLAASIVKDNGKVFAFEPNVNIFSLLKKSVEANNWENLIIVDNRALWNQENKRVKFYISNNPSNSGTSSLVLHGYYVSEDHYIEVETTTLDTYFYKHQIGYCRLIKIDVERAEYELLQGFSESLEKQIIDFILIEMFCKSPSHILLSDAGYKSFLVETGKGLIDTDNITNNVFGDYLFVSPKAYSEFIQIYPVIYSQLRNKNL